MKIYSMTRIMGLVVLSVLCFAHVSYAKSAAEIDGNVDRALELFQTKVPGAKDLLSKAKGVLVLPRVFKAGFGIGGEYGVGALRINGKTVEYYNIMGGSFGFQLGGQMRNVYLLFMKDDVLKAFRSSDGWKAGVDGSIALVAIGADGSIDTTKTDQPIMGFVLGQKGLMYNLTLEGSKFNKIQPS